MSASMTRLVERAIADVAIVGLLTAGYYITVDDGGETVLVNSKDSGRILDSMFTTGGDVLWVRKAPTGRFEGAVKFVYGNNGYDVIADYTLTLETALKGANAIADKYENVLTKAAAKAAAKIADRVDGYDRDDLGESPDF